MAPSRISHDQVEFNTQSDDLAAEWSAWIEWTLVFDASFDDGSGQNGPYALSTDRSMERRLKIFEQIRGAAHHKDVERYDKAMSALIAYDNSLVQLFKKEDHEMSLLRRYIHQELQV